MPKLSIIMPVYNTEKFLKRSIEAVLAQTFTNFEFILVNDGSTDHSLQICREYENANPCIHVIDQENRGAGAARNAGIDISRGEYIVFPDADDWIEKDTYRFCIETIEQTESDLLLFGMVTEVYDDTKEEVKEYIEDHIPVIHYKSQEACRENWIKLNKTIDLGSPCNKLYRRKLIVENDLRYPDLRRMQDVVFNIMYYEKITSFITIQKNFFHRTWHSAEFQLKKIPKDFIECAVAYHQKATEMLSAWNLLDKSARISLGESFFEIIMTAEFDYLPIEKSSFISIFKHIKRINNHPYIDNFYKNYKKDKNTLRKKEIAMMKKFNLLLTIDTYVKNKRRNRGKI